MISVLININVISLISLMYVTSGYYCRKTSAIIDINSGKSKNRS